MFYLPKYVMQNRVLRKKKCHTYITHSNGRDLHNRAWKQAGAHWHHYPENNYVNNGARESSLSLHFYRPDQRRGCGCHGDVGRVISCYKEMSNRCRIWNVSQILDSSQIRGPNSKSVVSPDFLTNHINMLTAFVCHPLSLWALKGRGPWLYVTI